LREKKEVVLKKEKYSLVWVAHACNPPSGGSWFKASHGQIILETLSQKCPTQNWAVGMVQVGEHLPRKDETLEFKTQYHQK
jgi:hypothetical protein